MQVVRFVVVHHHFRPGGVRRVIEVATPTVVKAAPCVVREVVLLTGERPPSDWLDGFVRRLAPVPVTCAIEPGLGYLAEQREAPQRIGRRLRAALGRWLGAAGDEVWVWIHNLGLGRNAVAAKALVGACRSAGARVLVHHHDWWFDHRWHRWPEIRRVARSLRAAAAMLIPTGRRIVHAGINRRDVSALKGGFGGRAVWLPNPVVLEGGATRERSASARRWLAERLGGDADSPVWLLPSRFLRRKNVGEAILVTRWLRPDAWLVTTAAPSSPEERPAFERLRTAAGDGAWRVRLAVMAGEPAGAPSIVDLLGACEAVVFTSILEGFGLPYLEAAAAGRPLVGRGLPSILPDLKRLGFRFPTVYPELRVSTRLFDLESEVRRQRSLLAEWTRALPAAVRARVGRPPILDRERAEWAPFGRLSLTAQLEVLRHPAAESWAACAPANPRLRRWKEQAESGELPPAPWPAASARRVSPETYARRLWREWRRSLDRGTPLPSASIRVQTDFIRERLRGEHLFPLLWNPET